MGTNLANLVSSEKVLKIVRIKILYRQNFFYSQKLHNCYYYYSPYPRQFKTQNLLASQMFSLKVVINYNHREIKSW